MMLNTGLSLTAEAVQVSVRRELGIFRPAQSRYPQRPVQRLLQCLQNSSTESAETVAVRYLDQRLAEVYIRYIDERVDNRPHPVSACSGLNTDEIHCTSQNIS